jgi:uncharacterized protein (DUF1330 family)
LFLPQDAEDTAAERFDFLQKCHGFTMVVYVLIDIAMSHSAAQADYAQYVQKVRPIVEKHGGRYLSRGGTIVPLAGDWNPEKIVLIEFPSMENVHQWWNSEEYQAIKGLREVSTTARAVVVEGFAS